MIAIDYHHSGGDHNPSGDYSHHFLGDFDHFPRDLDQLGAILMGSGVVFSFHLHDNRHFHTLLLLSFNPPLFGCHGDGVLQP